MTKKESTILVRLEERVDAIHDVLKGDEGLCKRVTVVEGDINKAKGAITVAKYWAGTIGGIVGAVAGYITRKF